MSASTTFCGTACGRALASLVPRECPADDRALSSLFSVGLRTAAGGCAAGGGPSPPPAVPGAAACVELATTELDTINQLCCKRRDCTTINVFHKCSAACAEVYVPFFRQCGVASYGSAHIATLSTLSQLCIDSHPNGGGGGRGGGGH